MTCTRRPGARPAFRSPSSQQKRAPLLPPPQLLLPLLLLLLLPTISEAQKYDALLRQALIANLGVERAQPQAAAAGAPTSAATGSAAHAQSGPAVEDTVPPYMLDLYRRYRSGVALKDGTNTIRCLKSKRASQLRPDLVFFNVASISDPATVVRAELHFNRRKMGALKEQAFHVTFYDVRESPSSADVTSAETLGFSQISRGWQTLDITPAVTRSVRRASTDHYQLGITLTPLAAGASSASAASAAVQSSYRGDVLPLTKAYSRPYILVYTNETANISEDQVYSRLRARGSGGIQEETKNMIDPVRGLNQQRSADDFEAAKHVFFLRHKRDLYDNEIPGDPDVSRRRTTADGGGVGRADAAATAQPTSQQQQQRSPRPTERSAVVVATGTTAKPKDGGRGLEQLIPWPRPGKSGSATSASGGDGGGSGGGARCGRRQLVLDFKDIGWDSWIIEPKSFEAGYCSGQCGFPDALSLNPTNHATLQSLLHAVGVRADVPTPCCVPDKLSSLTVLYFDHRKNVVLKTYPDMSAQSCACR